MELSKWEQDRADRMNGIHREARRQQRMFVTETAVSEAKRLLSDDTIRPSRRAQKAADRLARAYQTLEALQDG